MADSPYPIAPVTADDLADVIALAVRSFHSTWSVQAFIEHERDVFEPDRCIVARDGNAMVGTAAAYSFQLSVPGGQLPTAGVTGVAVHPGYRRRGILAALMRHQVADIASRGEALAALFASEPGIYGRFGYGCASEEVSLSIKRGESTQLPMVPQASRGELSLRDCEPAAVVAELGQCYAAEAAQRPGLPARDSRWWAARVDDPEEFRRGQTALRCLLATDADGPRGYALYATKGDWDADGIPAGVVSIRELIATDPGATAALWTDLLTQDLVGEVHARQRPVDEPLLHLLADRRRARPALSDGIWIRLVDVQAALCGRHYAAPADLVLEVSDDLVPGNTGRWRLTAAGPDGGQQVSCDRTTADPDLVLPVQALGAVYLGGTRLTALAAAGQLAELTPGAAARLSAAMYWDPAPWCPVTF